MADETARACWLGSLPLFATDELLAKTLADNGIQQPESIKVGQAPNTLHKYALVLMSSIDAANVLLEPSRNIVFSTGGRAVIKPANERRYGRWDPAPGGSAVARNLDVDNLGKAEEELGRKLEAVRPLSEGDHTADTRTDCHF